MASIQGIKKLTDLYSLSKLFDSAKTILAYNKENYATYLSDISGSKIVNITEQVSDVDGKNNYIVIKFADGTHKTLIVKNGNTGETGETGETGADGDKGINATIDTSKHGVVGMLPIVNDVKTNNAGAALSALQGVLINEEVGKRAEIFISDSEYQLLFNDIHFIEAEFTTVEDNETVSLLHYDTSSHKQYVKYWTFEDTGSTVYYIYNAVTNAYDSTPADLWNDIYLGKRSGYFEATSSQLTDGTNLYIYDKLTKNYEAITKVLNDSNQYLGSKTFKYYDTNIESYIYVSYDYVTGVYEYTLDAEETEIIVYLREGQKYTQVTDFSEINTLNMYYEKVGNIYNLISDIEAYITRPSHRYFAYDKDGKLVEVDSLESIDTSKYEEFVELEYDKSENKYVYTKHYKHVTALYTEYITKSSTYINGTITIYIKDENRKYYKRSQLRDAEGNITYQYNEISIPLWVTCEYTTIDEDEVTRILYSDKVLETDTEIEEDIYIDSIKITSELLNNGEYVDTELSTLEIALNKISDFDVKITPENANHTDLVIEYDENILTLYEDGRIAAVNTTDITTTTQIKIYAAHDPSIFAEIQLRIVTPVENIAIKLNTSDEQETTSTSMYIGQNIQLHADIYPKITSYHVAGFNGDYFGEFTNRTAANVKLTEYSYTAYKIYNGDIQDYSEGIYHTYADAVAKIPEFNTYTYQVFWDQDTVVNNVIDEFEFEDMNESNNKYMKYYNDTYTYTYWYTYWQNLVDDSMLPFVFTYSSSYSFIKHMYNNARIDSFDSNNAYIYTTSVTSVTNDAVTWISTDPDVLTVDEYGKLTAHKTGEIVTVIARAKDGFGAQANCKITTAIPITGIKFTNDNQAFLGINKPLTFAIEPEDATIRTVAVRVEDARIYKVEGNNTEKPSLTPLRSGKTMVYATTLDGSNITCSQEIVTTVGVSGITITPSEIDIDKTTTQQFTAVVLPDNADNNNVVWSVDGVDETNPIATITSEGVLTAKGAGVVTVVATAADGSGIKGTAKATIVTPISSIELDMTNITIFENGNQRITPKIYPSDATNTKLDYVSIDDSIATINNGVINGIAPGKTTIIVSATDNSGIYVTCVVNVLRAATALTVDTTAVRLRLGMSTTITATITPNDTSNQNVLWSSADPNVASVNSNGVITSHTIGSTTITVATTDGTDIKVDIPVVIVAKDETLNTTLTVSTINSYIGLSNEETVIPVNSEYETNIIYDTIYYNKLVDVSVYMGKTDITESCFDANENKVSISKVVDDIMIDGTPIWYTEPDEPNEPSIDIDDTYSYNDTYSYYDYYNTYFNQNFNS